MNVLITGARGFIGTHLCRHLAETYPNNNYMGIVAGMPERDVHPKVETFHCDITHTDLTFIKRFKPDIVFHLGGITSPSSNENKKILDVNIYGTMRLLDAVSCPIIFTSTANIWGSYPHKVERCTTLYAASKKSAESIIQSYVVQGKIPNANIIRLPGVVGIGMHGVVKKIVDDIETKDELVFMNNCKKVYCYIDDVVALLAQHIRLKQANDVCITMTLSNSPINVQDMVMIATEVFEINEKPLIFEGKQFAGDILDFYPPDSYNGLVPRDKLTSDEAVRRAFMDYKNLKGNKNV